MSSRVHSALLLAGRLLLVGSVLSACGGGNKSDLSASTSSTTASTSTSTSSSSSSPSSTTKTTTVKPVKIDYPSGGPGGPVFPPGTKAYALVAAGNCKPL